MITAVKIGGRLKHWWTACLALLAIALLLDCGGGERKASSLRERKMADLKRLKIRQSQLDSAIRVLEADLNRSRPDTAKAKPGLDSAAEARLVRVQRLQRQVFTHYIDLLGQVTTDNIYNVTPRGGGGQVVAIYVAEGDLVKKGQLLLKLDDRASRENLLQTQAQLDYATTIYQRRKNLWEQQIGTEVQFLQDKTNMETLQKQYQIAKEQWDATRVYAKAAGRVERLAIRVGELFTGSPDNGITIVDPTAIKAVVAVPENYLTKVNVDVPVVVTIAELDTQFTSRIALVDLVIDPQSRSFTAEAPIPATPALKAGLMATVKIEDFQARDVIVIPLMALQSDEEGKYVFVVATRQGRSVALRRRVEIGTVYGEHVIAQSGLDEGDSLITQGMQDLYDGQPVTVEVQ